MTISFFVRIYLVIFCMVLMGMRPIGVVVDPSDVYIDISVRNVSIQQALDEVRKRSNLGIVYNESDLPHDASITIDRKHISVKDALSTILRGTNLGYREYKGTLIIYKVQEKPEAQKNGAIEGKLQDEESREPLIGANVRILGTSMGSNADIEGHYIIKNVPPGVYQLAISYIGYETTIVRDVQVVAGQTLLVNSSLKASKTELQAIEVIGDRVLSGNVIETNEVSFVNSIKSSSLIITGISAQQIARSVDQDAGEVARRLPGVTVLNNFVNIRGMHERYNLTILNGMIAPSSEADRRAFSYDLLPSNMIDKMTVYRSPAPELLADWAGGVIKVETKNTSIARQLEVNVSSWFRPGSHFKDHYTYSGGGRDWMGRDDGTRALPNGFPAVGDIPAGGLGFPGVARDIGKYSPDQLAANANWGSQLYNKWNLKKTYAGMDYRAGINYYDAWKIGRIRFSNLTSINTTQASQITQGDFVPLRRIGSDGRVSDGRSYRDTVSQFTARWGLLQNLTMHLNAHNTIQFKGLYNQLGIDETLVRSGVDYILSDVSNGYVSKVIYTYRSRAVFGSQLAGSHIFGNQSRQSLQWTMAYNFSKEDVPAQRALRLTPVSTQLDNPLAPRYVTSNDLDFNTVNSLFYSSTKEVNKILSADYENKFSQAVLMRSGFFFEHKNKPLESRLVRISGLPLNLDTDERLDQYHAEKAFQPSSYKADGTGAYIYDDEQISGQYDVDGKIYAAYLAGQFTLLNQRLKFYGGVRYEGQKLVLNIPSSPYLIAIGSSPELINRYKAYWLPSINTSWNFTDKMLVRLAYGQTLNRPNFRELIPLYVNDPRLENLKIGNDSLRDARIHNFDARWEFYPSDGEFISIGGYYKRLYHAIEPYIFSTGKSEAIYFENTPKASVLGAEVEIRKSFNFLPWKWGANLYSIANVALLHSEVVFSNGLVPDNTGTYGSDSRRSKRPLEGTASYVINGGLYYDHEAWGTKLSLIYNVMGQRLVYAGTSFFPETYELPRHTIDITVRQRINKHIELRAGVQDILNQPRRLYRDYDRNQRWDTSRKSKLPYRDWIFQEYKPGSYYMLGLNFVW